MTRNSGRQGNTREWIAAEAARIMAEDGIDDFALAKRKAVRRLGLQGGRLALPGNAEIEAQLEIYRSLYQADEHPARVAELQRIALDAMVEFEQFRPYLTGPVLKGTAGPYAEIELQLFPENPKEIELHLLERRIPFDTREVTRYSGDRARAVAVLTLEWEGAPLKLSVFDPRDERLALKTSAAGRVAERAGLSEVGAIVAKLDEPG